MSDKAWSQDQLARAVGTKQSTVSGWLNRGSQPRGAARGKLASALGVTQQWLYLGVENADPPSASPDKDTGRPPVDFSSLAASLLKKVSKRDVLELVRERLDAEKPIGVSELKELRFAMDYAMSPEEPSPPGKGAGHSS